MRYLCNNNDREICKQALLLIFDKCRREKYGKKIYHITLSKMAQFQGQRETRETLGSCLVIWWYGKQMVNFILRYS